MFYNFNRHPTPTHEPADFLPTTVENTKLFSIGNDGIKLETNYGQKYIQFWDDLLVKYEKIFSEKILKTEL